MEKLINTLLEPQALTALAGFLSGVLVIGIALMKKFNVISKQDVDFAIDALKRAKEAAGDMKETISGITDATVLNKKQVVEIAAELASDAPGDTSRKKALRMFRRVRKGFLGI